MPLIARCLWPRNWTSPDPRPDDLESMALAMAQEPRLPLAVHHFDEKTKKGAAWFPTPPHPTPDDLVPFANDGGLALMTAELFRLHRDREAIGLEAVQRVLVNSLGRLPPEHQLPRRDGRVITHAEHRVAASMPA